MSGSSQKLTLRQEQAIGALLCQPTFEKAAEMAGVGVATLRRWLKCREFIAHYREARRQMVEQAIARLQQVARDAVDTMAGCLQEASASIRLRASVAILEQAIKGVELVDLEERVALLEEAERQ